MADFSNYELGEIAEQEFGVYQLADELIPEMAETLRYDITGRPVQETLGDFIGQFGPDKEYQKNISLVKDRVSVDQAADWVERSGALVPVARAFRDNTPLPERFGVAVMTGGIANWILRRTAVLEQVDPTTVSRVWMVPSNRKMDDGEHQLVKSHRERFGLYGVETTEAAFMKHFISKRLGDVWFNYRIHDAHGMTKGSNVLDHWATFLATVDNAVRITTFLVPTNAPASIQTAVTVREALQKIDPTFDTAATPQLFMMGDSIPVARHGEHKSTHQDPHSAIGQLLRNARYLDRAAAQLRAA